MKAAKIYKHSFFYNKFVHYNNVFVTTITIKQTGKFQKIIYTLNYTEIQMYYQCKRNNVYI